MSGKPARRLPPAGGRTPIERVELQQFARRLFEAMTAKGMSQSDLARAVWGETTDSRGSKVARNRDRISQYLKGTSYPEPANMRALADALGLSIEELAPDLTAATVERENPEISMTMIGGHADKVYLQVNKLVSLSVASQVIQLLAALDESLNHRG